MASSDAHGGLRSSGSHQSHIIVGAFCRCGWVGPSHPWCPGANRAEQEELAAHLADSGHHEYRIGVPPPEGYHYACGHFHQLNDACPIAADSSRGRVERITVGSTLGRPDRALDRLAAIAELNTWIGDQEKEAVIGARLTRCTWAEIGDAVGVTEEDAQHRWGPMIARYERSGLLDADRSPTDRR
ncbi:MAG TPA: hypothetical protein VHT75_02935 [Acidimicrobiales bacterium]|nr:hypothetical protein [Acidimicrobiales bacterium]